MNHVFIFRTIHSVRWPRNIWIWSHRPRYLQQVQKRDSDPRMTCTYIHTRLGCHALISANLSSTRGQKLPGNKLLAHILLVCCLPGAHPKGRKDLSLKGIQRLTHWWELKVLQIKINLFQPSVWHAKLNTKFESKTKKFRTHAYKLWTNSFIIHPEHLYSAHQRLLLRSIPNPNRVGKTVFRRV